MLQTQIFTQKYRSWLRFYSEFLRKNLVAEVSGLAKCLTKCYHFTVYVSLIKLNLRNVQEYFAITWNSNTTETNWSRLWLCPDNLSKKLLGGGSVLYIHLFFFRVSTDLVSTSERPSVYQWANSFANLRNCKNQGCCITVEKGLIDLCHVMTSFYRPRPASEPPNLQHLLI